MGPRDIFDGVLLVVLAIVLYLDRNGRSPSLDPLRAGIEALLSLDTAVYLVVAGVLGAAFVGYIAVYLPYKQSENPQRR